MINSSAKRPQLVTTVSRRRLLNASAAAAGGFVAGTILPSPVLQALADQCDANNCDLHKFGATNINYMTSVKHQGPCNACTAFAVVATIEGTYNRKNFGASGDKGLNLSEGQLFYAAGPKDKCYLSHWWPRDALPYCTQVGLAREDEEQFAFWDNSTPKPTISIIKIAGSTSLIDSTNLNKTKQNMKNWIFQTGPVIAVMVQYEDFQAFGDAWATSHPDAENTNVYFPGVGGSPGGVIGGHVVSIVGYSDTGTPKYWICKNSWGKKWNGDGYVRIAQGSGASGECYIESLEVLGVLLS